MTVESVLSSWAFLLYVKTEWQHFLEYKFGKISTIGSVFLQAINIERRLEVVENSFGKIG